VARRLTAPTDPTDDDIALAISRRIFGARVRQARLGTKLDQEHVAAAIGLTQGALSFIERGITTPNTEHARRLGTVLGVDPAALLDYLPTLTLRAELYQALTAAGVSHDEALDRAADENAPNEVAA
jgi:transcriptional regulator with XRE-family HTH domain